MKKIHCDICGKEIKSDSPMNKIWDSELFFDTDEEYIEDVCEECFKVMLCCINMMKKNQMETRLSRSIGSGRYLET